MWPATLVQLRTVDLDPSPDATGIDSKSTLDRHLCHMRERDWIPQVPSHAPHDNVTGIVAPLERIRGSDGQHSPYQPAPTRFRNGTAVALRALRYRGTRGRLATKSRGQSCLTRRVGLAGRIGLDANAEPEGQAHASFGSGSPSLSARRSARSSFPIESARTSVTRCLMPSRSYSRVRTAPCTIT